MCGRRPAIILLSVALVLGSLILYAAFQLGDICPEGGGRCTWAGAMNTLDYLRGKGSNGEGEPKEGDVTSAPAVGTATADKPVDPSCHGFPDMSNILLVMKTGASEAYSKIPTQMLTNLRCVSESNFLIFSDMAQSIAGQEIIDTLETVIPEVKEHQDFELYHNQVACPIDQETCNKGINVAKQGWALDKYKNIHMAEKAYARNPGFDWYLYVDADTYVVWSTLVEWLSRVDAKQKIYMGSVAMLGGFPFAHGGSGYLVSQGMMAAMFDGKENVANRFDQNATGLCCGDALFSMALKEETDVSVQNVWPTVNGEKPNTLSYEDSQWCQPLVTMHHIGSEEVSDFYEWECSRNYTQPVRIKDLYHQFIKPHLDDTRAEWDNLSDDIRYADRDADGIDSTDDKYRFDNLSEVEQEAHDSATNCRAACLELEECMQWRFHRNVCYMGRKIRHGNPIIPGDGDGEKMVSGWHKARIAAWAKEHEDCGEIQWPNVRTSN
ncbi:uncharacterized protein F5Z01DRAFT_695078 [Emericellopsis atlantica]|uniref:N-acetylgalactosaminide beta-1,3-galactosyltransferase n=1 Tax=Emericellopsis atlantica TaxID=2614577 RepID=A0A9P7ZSV8_9HYPO|nr:uncharacterized protein F5Z01DRAFT_695078 [Emericellopsis atlantica]KAG9257694.1 hypothetical protein F5Z01DRAFT_695078 [Emericellopsis atlantica]